jgi:hypothetical protein
MLDVRQVLAKKERDLVRLKREIAALQRVIPRLQEAQPRSPAAVPVAKKPVPPPCRNPAEAAERGMAELELYYPFVGRGAQRR